MEETTFLAHFLPDAIPLLLDSWELDNTTSLIRLHVTSTQRDAPCPVCAMLAYRLHRRYERLPALPALCQRTARGLCRRPGGGDAALESGTDRRAHQSPEDAEAPDVWPRTARSAGPTRFVGGMMRIGSSTMPARPGIASLQLASGMTVGLVSMGRDPDTQVEELAAAV
jgi:hypothetical protein